ncbi:MAG: VOC family protein [Myxococcales bacterium]|nr:VOC family protein [Myxococcales bacterium]
MNHVREFIEPHWSDPKKAQKFHGSPFDWKFNTVPMPHGEYTLIGMAKGGGGMTRAQPGIPRQRPPYVNVADVAASAKKAATLGAKIVMEKTEVPEFGWFSMITDPTGATLAPWEMLEKR